MTYDGRTGDASFSSERLLLHPCLYALIKVHFAKEEEIYAPLLEARLTGDEARELFAAMDRAAYEIKAQLAREA